MENEAVMVVSKQLLPADWIEREVEMLTDESILIKYLTNNFVWKPRSIAETDKNYKQIIPYMLTQYKDGSFACYPRQGNEKRLHGLWSAGIGGHISKSDFDDRKNIYEIIVGSAIREMNEEFIEPPVNELQLLGIINEEQTIVGHVHLGIVFLSKMNKKPLPAAETKGLQWLSTNQMNKINLEIWSKLAFKLYIKSCS